MTGSVVHNYDAVGVRGIPHVLPARHASGTDRDNPRVRIRRTTRPFFTPFVDRATQTFSPRVCWMSANLRASESAYKPWIRSTWRVCHPKAVKRPDSRATRLSVMLNLDIVGSSAASPHNVSDQTIALDGEPYLGACTAPCSCRKRVSGRWRESTARRYRRRDPDASPARGNVRRPAHRAFDSPRAAS